MKEYYFDLHTHMLPGLDDGAKDFAQAEKMLETAQSSGDSRWVSILMNELGRHGRKQRKAFEL